MSRPTVNQPHGTMAQLAGDPSNWLVLPAPGAAHAAAFADCLGATLGTVEWRRFPDGETYLRLHDALAGRHVAVVANLRDPDPQALGLCYLAATARELGARRVGLVAPYLPYLRQDSRFRPGEAVTAPLFARFVSQQFDWVVTVDPHLHRIPRLSAVYSVPAVAVASAPAIARWVAREVQRPVIVGPDAESEQWAAEVARLAGCGVLVLAKTRRGDREVEVSAPHAAAHRGCTPVLVDDIISSARTMAQAVRQVRSAFGVAPVCVGVHALFAGDAMQALAEAGASRVVSCNTVPHATNAIDLLPALAATVQAFAEPD